VVTTRKEAHPGAADFVPATDDLDALAQAVQGCRGCDLYRDATQAVFGQGPPHADVVLLGEQPGDMEDKRGEPFVGPAGGLLHRALREAGMSEKTVYVTNVVKHFRWRQDPRGGKRRIHQRPDAGHIAACRPWWQGEVRLLRPKVLVALGATAGEALFGASFRVGKVRGTVLDWPIPEDWDEQPDATIAVVPTVHPSSVLRAPDRDEAYAGFVEDLRSVTELLPERDRIDGSDGRRGANSSGSVRASRTASLGCPGSTLRPGSTLGGEL
jgi:uracil-DNA glycosylase family protein